MDARLQDAARELGDKVQGLVVVHHGLAFALEYVEDSGLWSAIRTDFDDLGEGVMITRYGATPIEALDACHEIAEMLARDGELPDELKY